MLYRCGNKHRISCSQRVERQNAKRRRTVYQNEIELAHCGFQRFCQFLFTPNHRSHLYLCTRQTDVGRQQAELIEQVDVYSAQRIERANLAEKNFVDGPIQTIGSSTAAAGGICLRINVYEQRFMPLRSETRSEIDGSRGFTHAALLVGNGDDRAQKAPAWKK